MHDEDAARRQIRDLAGGRAEDAIPPFVPVAPDHDEIRAALLGHLDDHGPGLSDANRERRDDEIRRALGERGELSPRLLHGLREERVRSGAGAGGRKLRGKGDDAEPVELGPEPASDLRRVIEHDGRAWGRVESDEDSREQEGGPSSCAVSGQRPEAAAPPDRRFPREHAWRRR